MVGKTSSSMRSENDLTICFEFCETVRRSCGPGGSVEPDPGRREGGLEGAAGEAGVVVDQGGDGGVLDSWQLLEQPFQERLVGFDGHHVVCLAVEYRLRCVSLRVQCVEVVTVSARSANACSSCRTASISLDFSSAASWPRTAPMPSASASTRCRSFQNLLFSPQTVLSSIAKLSRSRTDGPSPVLVAENPFEPIGADQGERASVAALRRAAFGRVRQRFMPGIGSPLLVRGARPRAGDDRRVPLSSSPASWCRRPRLFRGSLFRAGDV